MGVYFARDSLNVNEHKSICIYIVSKIKQKVVLLLFIHLTRYLEDNFLVAIEFLHSFLMVAEHSIV